VNEFDQAVIEAIGYYVYRLEDPRLSDMQRTFYVGKGMGNRAFQHARDALADPTPSDKLDRIRDIIRCGKRPLIVIHRHGLDEGSALHVEGALIDAYGVESLTNEQRGQGTAQGMMTADEVAVFYAAQEARISEPVILIKIEREWRRTLTPDQLYERTRRYWTANPNNRRVKPQFAMSVARGIIRAVYTIDRWESYPPVDTADTAPHDLARVDPVCDADVAGCVGFIGQLAADKCAYINQSVRHLQSVGAQNPIKYLNCER